MIFWFDRKALPEYNSSASITAFIVQCAIPEVDMLTEFLFMEKLDTSYSIVDLLCSTAKLLSHSQIYCFSESILVFPSTKNHF